MGSLHVLVTGATGYVGGRLVPRLLEAGYRVRVLVRNPDKIRDVPWADRVEIARGDLTRPDSLAEACRDIDVVYYLVHSMNSAGDFEDTERRSAQNMATAAADAGAGRIVYLGGLHEQSDRLSTHLRSRTQVGQILIDSPVPTLVLQAGVVIGSGSASFEMIRHLTNRLPVMTTPRWVNNHIQPIAVGDVLHYLIAAATAELPRSRTYDIGGPDVLRYGQMMQIYAEVAGLARRRILVLPVLTPKLAGLWIGLVTPVPLGIGRALIESLSTDAIAGEHDIDDLIAPPPGGATPYRAAVALALRSADRSTVDIGWDGSPADPLPSDPDWTGEIVHTEDRHIDCDTGVDAVWQSLLRWTDSHPQWEVEHKLEPDLLQVCGPRRTRLQWRTAAGRDTYGNPHTRLRQRAIVTPKGLPGQLYWHGLKPLHRIRLGRVLRAVAGDAKEHR
ncbi:DUF2867 domain-containing protein [Mycobacterium sp. C31M]